MKFICDRTELAEAVNIVQKAVPSNSTMPVLEGILIKAQGNKVILMGNDLEIGIECIIDAEIQSTGSVVVNSKLFGEIIRKLTGDVLYFDVNSNNVTNIKCGNSKFKITGIESLEFPEVQKFESKNEIKITQKQLKELVRQTIFAVGTSEAKLILTGCFFEAWENNISMVAVDGFRLALKKIVCDETVISGGNAAGIVIPAKTLNELVKIIEDCDDEIKIIYTEKNIRFEFDNVTFVSRLLEGDYIDYKRIIPSEFKTTLKTDVRSLLQAVERASLIITSDVNKAPVILDIRGGAIELTCETQAGRVEEVIPVDFIGDEFKIGFNNKFLYDALKAATSENIKINLIGKESPCLIEPEEGDDYKFIVLPVRI